MRAVFKDGSIKECSGIAYSPPSKSMAHRFLIASALSKDEVEVSNVGFSEDIKATLDCLSSLGCKVEIENDRVKICGKDFLHKNHILLLLYQQF